MVHRSSPVIVALLVLNVLGCSGHAQVQTGQCCAAGLLDPAKLLHTNRPGFPAGIMTATQDFSSDQPIDLARFLREPAPEMLIWIVDGFELKDSKLYPKSAPGEDSAIIYRVGVRHRNGSQRDEFRLILLALSTRERFAAWLSQEENDMGWLKSLPPVYASLGTAMTDPEPANCSKRYWEGVHKLDSNFHPGAAYEMRSKVTGGDHGHQAVYDSSGKLIREGLGAGSADKGAPRFWASGLLKHRDRDVRPFVWAAQLDGNPVKATKLYLNLDEPLIRLGEHISGYQRVRPALANDPAEISAGTCIDRP
jgi:hypothetical protein